MHLRGPFAVREIFLRTCCSFDVTVFVVIAVHFEASWQGNVGGKLDRIATFPFINQVISGPSIWKEAYSSEASLKNSFGSNDKKDHTIYVYIVEAFRSWLFITAWLPLERA